MIKRVNELCDWVKTVIPWHHFSELLELVVKIVTGRLLNDVKHVKVYLVVKGFQRNQHVDIAGFLISVKENTVDFHILRLDCGHLVVRVRVDPVKGPWLKVIHQSEELYGLMRPNVEDTVEISKIFIL